MSGLTEQLVALADQRFAILSGRVERHRALLVWLNAGFLPHVGPFRLHVELARQLATQGWASARFDAPGIGDSLAASATSPVRALREDLDALQTATGCSEFVIGGICSAADLAWATAQVDSRVRGIVMLDGMARGARAYRWGQLNLLLRYRSPLRWPGLILKQLLPRRDATDSAECALRAEDYRDWPAAGSEGEQLAALLERDVRLFVRYTGGAADYFLHPAQFAATFGAASRDARIDFAHWPHCDHLFFDPTDRARLASALHAWLNTLTSTRSSP
jgi:hypothetical protein